MSDTAQRLQIILDAEEELYVRLRDLLQKERGIVLCMDAAGLQEIARSKEEFGDQARLLEESRLEVAAELAVGIGLPAKSNLSTICSKLSERGSELRLVHNRLVILVSVVRELLDANADLVGESLSEVRATLRLLGGLLPEENLYCPNGPPAAAMATGRLLRRSA